MGTTIPYFANSVVEAVFHVPSLIPLKESGGDQSQFAETLGSILEPDLVSIVWLEDPIDMTSLPSKFGATNVLVYLCVCPMKDEESLGLYRIRVMVTQPQSNEEEAQQAAGLIFGPLLDGMLLRREMLGSLVRSTAISASLFALHQVKKQPRPAETRSLFISSMAQSFALPIHPTAAPHEPEPFYHFYDALLFGGKVDEVEGGGLVSGAKPDREAGIPDVIGEISVGLDTISMS